MSNGSLWRQKDWVWKRINDLNLDIRVLVGGPEYGKLSAERYQLGRALALARRLKAGVVAADTTRLLRPEAYDKATNRWAVPTEEEVKALLARAKGVLFVATIADPLLTPEELHAAAVRRGMEAAGNPGGRPSSIDQRLAELIWNDRRNGDSYRVIAKRYDLSHSAVQRSLQKSEKWLAAATRPRNKG